MSTTVGPLNNAVVSHHSQPQQQAPSTTSHKPPVQTPQKQQKPPNQKVPAIQLTSKPRQRFSEDDDKHIIKAVSNPLYCKSKGQRQSLLGIDASWTKIAREVFGGKFKRESIRTRYRRKLHPNLKQGRWTADEDNRLLGLYDIHGSQWTTISAEMNFERNDLQCRDRYAMLVRKKKALSVDAVPATSAAASARSNPGTAAMRNGLREASTIQQSNDGQLSHQRRQKQQKRQQKQQQQGQMLSMAERSNIKSFTDSRSMPSVSSSPTSLSPMNSLSMNSTCNGITSTSPYTPVSSSASSPFLTCNMAYDPFASYRPRTTVPAGPTTLTASNEKPNDGDKSPKRLVDGELIRGVSDLMKLKQRSLQTAIQAQYQQLLYQYRYYIAFQQQQHALQELHQYHAHGNSSYQMGLPHQQQQQSQSQLGFFGMPSPSPLSHIMYPSQPTTPISALSTSADVNSSLDLKTSSQKSPADDIDTEMTTPDSATSPGNSRFDISPTDSTQGLSRGRGSYYYRGFKFTEGADSKLLAAVNSPRYRINGGAEVDWSSIAKEEFQGNAAPSMLQRRYLRAMHPNLKQDEWTTEEDKRLLQLHADYGGQWLTISEGMDFTRSDYQCRKRFQELKGTKVGTTTTKHCGKRKNSNTNPGEHLESDGSVSPTTILKSTDVSSESGSTDEPLAKRLRTDETLGPELETMTKEQQASQQQQSNDKVHQVVENTMAEQQRLSL